MHRDPAFDERRVFPAKEGTPAPDPSVGLCAQWADAVGDAPLRDAMLLCFAEAADMRAQLRLVLRH